MTLTTSKYLRAAASARSGIPAAYAAAAKVKFERDRKSFEAFRKIDQEEHDRKHQQQVTKAVSFAEDKVRMWREDVAEWQPEAEAALAAFRDAEDRHRSAAEFSRQQRAVYEGAKGNVSPAEETDLLIRADTADTVTADAAEVLAGRQAELTSADASLADARERLATAERTLDRARKAAEVPAGPAELSETTIRANASYLQADEVWATLDRDVRFRLHYLAEPRGVTTDEEWREQLRVLAAANGGGS